MKHPLYTGVLACALAGTAHAQDHVQVYGRLNVALEHVDNGGSFSQTRETNNRSVLGFRGSEDLGNGLKAIFQVEGTISPDTGTGRPRTTTPRLAWTRSTRRRPAT
jgi:predicted porin